MDEPSEDAASEMSDFQIPAVDVEMVVDETPIQFTDDPSPTTLKTYAEEMRKSGLLSSDIKCFKRAYKNLEEVKYANIHCTSCDKHLGSAPGLRATRYEHPLLRVIVCQQCFEFYSSGDFEKDEDGSEMYCRWCGEGGDVFCCTKCPFVFCKKCIRQNLGSGTARSIQSSMNWMCFVCKPAAISRLRALCWALQKWSEEMLQKAEVDSKIDVSFDSNICCTRAKKPPQIYGTSKVPVEKKSKSTKPSTADAKKTFIWHSAAPGEAQAEVICTPDIIPVEDSPCTSPKPETVTSTPIQIKPKLQIVAQLPSSVRPPIQNMAELQKHLAAAFPQKFFIAQTSQLAPKSVILKSTAAAAAGGNAAPRNLVSLNDNNKYKLLITNPVANAIGNRTNYLLTQLSAANTITTTAIVHSPTGQKPTMLAGQKPALTVQKLSVTALPKPAASPAVQPTANRPVNKLEWFEQGLLHCSEVTDFITSKVANLSDIHTRACKSVALMDELHYTMQTFLFAAVEKLKVIKKTMYTNFMAQHGDKLINPYSNAQKRKIIDCCGSTTDSESSYYRDFPMRWKRRKKNASKRAKTGAAGKQDDVPLDMTVTHESDEHSLAGDDVELVGEIQTKGVSNEIISLLESTDEEEEEEEEDEDAGDGDKEATQSKSESISNGVPETDTELAKHSCAVVVVEQMPAGAHARPTNNGSDSPEPSAQCHTETGAGKCPVTCNETESHSSKASEELCLANSSKHSSDTPTIVDEVTTEPKVEMDNNSDTEQNVEETNVTNNLQVQDVSKPMKETGVDIEDMIKSAVLPNSNSKNFKRFADAFSRFISVDPRGTAHADDDSTTATRDSVHKMFDLMGSDMDYMDNRSLSVPPSDLKEFVKRNFPNSVAQGHRTDTKDAKHVGKRTGKGGKGKGKGKTKRSAIGRDASTRAAELAATRKLILESEIMTIEPLPGNSAGSSVDAKQLSAECQG